MNEPLARVGVAINFEIHKQAKIRAIQMGMSLSKYIEYVLRKDLETEKENE